MNINSINPPSLFNSRQFGFSQIVISNPGKLVYISGQVAWDENMNMVGKNNFIKQTEKSLENVITAIEAVGGTTANIVILRIYKVNYQPEDGEIITRVLKEKFGNYPPASSWINVKGLANPDFMIEIEAQGVI